MWNVLSCSLFISTDSFDATSFVLLFFQDTLHVAGVWSFLVPRCSVSRPKQQLSLFPDTKVMRRHVVDESFSIICENLGTVYWEMCTASCFVEIVVAIFHPLPFHLSLDRETSPSEGRLILKLHYLQQESQRPLFSAKFSSSTATFCVCVCLLCM